MRQPCGLGGAVLHRDGTIAVIPSDRPGAIRLRRDDLKPKPLLVPDHHQAHAHRPLAGVRVKRAPNELPQLAGGAA